MRLYGNETVSVDEFLPMVQAEFDGIDTDLAGTYIMNAVIEFIKDSKVLRNVECVPFECCIDAYLLQIPNDMIFYEVMAVRVFSNGKLYDYSLDYYVNDSAIYFNDLPILQDGLVEIEYVYMPRRNTFSVPEQIFEVWLEAVVALAKSKIYAIGSMDWASNSLSQFYLQRYEVELRKALVNNITKHKALNIKLRPKWGN